MDNKLDLFQSLKDEMNDNLQLPSISEIQNKTQTNNIKSETDDDDELATPGPSENIFDKAFKRKLDKQNRKELEEEEREKML